MTVEELKDWYDGFDEPEAPLPVLPTTVDENTLLDSTSTTWREFDQDGYHVIEMNSPTAHWRIARNKDTQHIVSQYSGQLHSSSEIPFESPQIEFSSKKNSGGCLSGCFGCLGCIFSGIFFLAVICLMLYGMGYIGKIIVDFLRSLF